MQFTRRFFTDFSVSNVRYTYPGKGEREREGGREGGEDRGMVS